MKNTPFTASRLFPRSAAVPAAAHRCRPPSNGAVYSDPLHLELGAWSFFGVGMLVLGNFPYDICSRRQPCYIGESLRARNSHAAQLNFVRSRAKDIDYSRFDVLLIISNQKARVRHQRRGYTGKPTWMPPRNRARRCPGRNTMCPRPSPRPAPRRHPLGYVSSGCIYPGARADGWPFAIDLDSRAQAIHAIVEQHPNDPTAQKTDAPIFPSARPRAVLQRHQALGEESSPPRPELRLAPAHPLRRGR